MTDKLQQELALARELARKAGARILEHYTKGFDVEYKDKYGDDPVTLADKDANDIIVKALREAYPEDGILAEESPADDERLGRRRLWCIDPLDGTRELVDRNGQFVVMIGLAIDGVAKLGVVYQPTEDILWSGIVGEGAHEERSDGQRVELTVTDCVDPKNATMMASRSHRSETVGRVAASLGITKQMPLGSVGLKVSRIATANAEVYISVTNKTQEWDACGPEAILTAAGGKMTDIAGRPLVYNKASHETPYGILASNGVMHDACVAALEPVVKDKGWD